MILFSATVNMHKKYQRLSSIIMRAWLIVLLQFCFLSAQAQQTTRPDSTLRKKNIAFADTTSPTAQQNWNHYRNKYFTTAFGFAVLLDHNIVSQNAENVEQVGKIDPATEFRANRLVVSGSLLFFKNPWNYFIIVNYNGPDKTDDKITVLDYTLDIPLGGNGGFLAIGKQKEGVSYEFVQTGTRITFMERGSGVPALVRQRNYGIRYRNSRMNDRLTYTVGLFNHWVEKNNKFTFKENGIQLTSRVTALPVYHSDRNLVHAGIGYRYADAPGGKIIYRGRPEANTAPYFIKTDSIPASGAHTFMVEGMGVNGPFTLLAEYMQAFVSSKTFGNPSFNYWQVEGSWFITGENREYHKQLGVFSRLKPKRNFSLKKGGAGAFELGARYTRSDFVDNEIDGGEFGRLSTVLSWYPNPIFRFEVNYGYGLLTKESLQGKVNILQFRAQFEY